MSFNFKPQRKIATTRGDSSDCKTTKVINGVYAKAQELKLYLTYLHKFPWEGLTLDQKNCIVFSMEKILEILALCKSNDSYKIKQQ